MLFLLTCLLLYVRLFVTQAEKKNKIKAEERTHGQRETDNPLHETSLYYYPKN